MTRVPDLAKDYNFEGRVFTVTVTKVPELDEGTIRYWEYEILVRGNLVQKDTYSWDTAKRPLTNQQVANHLASFWGFNDVVAQAQDFPKSPEIILNEIVLKCAELMHQYYMAPGEFQDYEIVSKFMNDEEWHVVLSPNYIKGRMIEFFCKAPAKHVEVTVYNEDRSFNTVL